jgi:hypothetical protein
MPIYIDETRRGYPDPVNWDTADIELYGQGKGSYLFGKDEVFYIGDPEEVVLASTSTRRKVYRMYDGRAVDHLYTTDDSEKPRSYNREPRSNQEYVFTVMTSQVSGSVPLYRHYSSANTDHKYSLNASESGYTQQSIMGYVFTSYSAAQTYSNSKIGEVAKPVYYYYNSSGKDSFYTLRPSTEVNLQEYNSGALGPPYPGDDRQDPDRGDEYTYMGILCWTFERMSGTDTKRVIEIGKPQYAGTSFLYGWLTDVNGGTATGNTRTNWTAARYSLIATRNYLINDQRANFTFLYGEFGPVKAALPRFIGTKYLYDSQFFYYLYDTTDPWNGPLYGVRMMTEKNSAGNCCIETGGGEGGTSVCPESDPWIYRYYYQLRPNVWKTKKSRIYTDVKNDEGQDQNILTAGTDDKIIFFRYSAGSFNMTEGDIVNGWRVTEHRYMGDELTTGFIRLSPATEGVDGSTFTYGSVYTNNNSSYPASFVALAGYGIENKCAIFGVYEFKKKVSYYKVELYADAAVPKRTMDEADIEAVVDNNGKVSDLIIHNGGYGYSTDARVEIMSPPTENTSADIENTRTYYLKNQIIDTTGTTLTWTKNPSYKTVGQGVTEQVKNGVTINETSLKLKPANVQITGLSAEGCIQSVKILESGSGYNQQSPPKVIVYDPHKFVQDNSPRKDIGEDLLATGKNSQDKLLGVLSSIGQSSNVSNDLGKAFRSSDLTSGIKDAFKKFDDGVTGTIYTGYIKGPGDIDPENYMEFCLGIPTSCANPTFSTWDPLNTYTSDFFRHVINYDQTGGFKNNYSFLNTTGKQAITNLGKTADNAGGLYGAFNPAGNLQCLKMQQPKLYKVNRFYDIPCAYTVGAGDTKKVYAYMPYQYCASKKESDSFNIYIEVDGDFTGSASSTAQNTAFINKLKGLQAPKKLAPRPAAAGVKTWHCTRGNYDGRCFRAADGDISFYPIGLDENVYDYTHLTVYEAYNVWIGQPSNTLAGTAGTLAGLYYFWLGGGAAVGTKYTGPNQPSTSWDHYVYDASTNPNGLFFKYTGYDENGNGAGQQTRWQNYIYTMPPCEGVTDIDSMIAFDPTQIAINNDLVRLGPFQGKVTIKNYSTGSAKVYAQAFNNLGNPYFESCLNATN